MKKLLLLFLFIFAFAVPVNAFNPLLVCTGAVASASCDTEKDAVTGGQTQAPDLFKFANSDWNATKFTAGDTYTVCKIGVYLYRTATAASYTITACIYSDDGGVGDASEPDTQIGTCSSPAVAQSTLTESATEIAFTNVSADITSGTSYWIVLQATGDDSTNLTKSSCYNGASVELIKYSGDGSSWSLVSDIYSTRYKLYE